MNNLKKSKKKFNRIMYYSYLKKKSYLVFRLNNYSKVIIDSVYKKLNKNYSNTFIFNLNNKIYFSILFNISNYFYVKKSVFQMLNLENFNYELFCVKIGTNKLSIDFFESQILLKINKLELIKEVFAFNNILLINNNIIMKKNLFILLNLFLINFNIFKINVYNSSSCF